MGRVAEDDCTVAVRACGRGAAGHQPVTQLTKRQGLCLLGAAGHPCHVRVTTAPWKYVQGVFLP